MSLNILNLENWEFNTVDNIKEPERYLLKAQDILNRFGVKWYLGFGTALGLYRDKDFIKGDTDVDLVIIADENTPTLEIDEAFEKEFTFIRSVSNYDKQMQSAFQGNDGFIVDVCYFYEDGDYLYSDAEGGTFKDLKSTIGTPKLLETKYGSFPIPENIEEYLIARYGDWKTPKYGAITSSIKV